MGLTSHAAQLSSRHRPGAEISLNSVKSHSAEGGTSQGDLPAPCPARKPLKDPPNYSRETRVDSCVRARHPLVLRHIISSSKMAWRRCVSGQGVRDPRPPAWGAVLHSPSQELVRASDTVPQTNGHILSLSRKKTAQPARPLGGLPPLRLKQRSDPNDWISRGWGRTLRGEGFWRCPPAGHSPRGRHPRSPSGPAAVFQPLERSCEFWKARGTRCPGVCARTGPEPEAASAGCGAAGPHPVAVRPAVSHGGRGWGAVAGGRGWRLLRAAFSAHAQTMAGT